MSDEELILIRGGTTLNTTLLNTFVRFVSSSLELGRALGTTIRRMINKKKCSYN